jgi:hypothetical protein
LCEGRCAIAPGSGRWSSGDAKGYCVCAKSPWAKSRWPVRYSYRLQTLYFQAFRPYNFRLQTLYFPALNPLYYLRPPWLFLPSAFHPLAWNPSTPRRPGTPGVLSKHHPPIHPSTAQVSPGRSPLPSAQRLGVARVAIPQRPRP